MSHHLRKGEEIVVADRSRWITRYLPFRFVHFVHFKCQLDLFWPVLVNNNMAPRNLQQPSSSNSNGIHGITSQEDLISPEGMLLLLLLPLPIHL